MKFNKYQSFRPFEVIAVATHNGISIWHMSLDLDPEGRLSVERVALLSGHTGEVCVIFRLTYS